MIFGFGPYISGIISFVFLVFASWCVGEGGEILGQKYDASIIGGLIIAWLNTAPEAIFFVTALRSNNPHFAMGAVSGSTIVVSTIAVGACFYFGTVSRHSGFFTLQPAVKFQCLLLVISGIFPLIIAYTQFTWFMAIIGSLAYIAFLLWELLKPADILDSHPDVEEGKTFNDSESSEAEQSTMKGVLFLVLGGGLIFMFSEIFIVSVVGIATKAQVNPMLLAFFLAPIASEMPEILESISLSRKGKLQNINIAISNLMGGTITKTTLLSGIFCYYGVTMDLK